MAVGCLTSVCDWSHGCAYVGCRRFVTGGEGKVAGLQLNSSGQDAWLSRATSKACGPPELCEGCTGEA